MKFYAPMDSETGGLDHKKADMLTFYVAIVDEDFKVIDELDMKLKPNDGRPPIAEAGALRVNKIDVKAHMADPNTLTYAEAKDKLTAFLSKYSKRLGKTLNIRPMGHNLAFDLGFIWEYLMPKDEWNKLVHYGNIDTKSNADFLKDGGWLPQDIGTLDSLVKFLGVSQRDAHNAKEDSLMTLDCYKKMLDLLKGKKDNGGTQDLISLMEQE